MKIKTLSLLTLLLLAGVSYAEVSFEASVDKLKAAFEDKIQVILRVTVTDPNVQTSPLPPPDIPGFSLGGSASSVDRTGDRIVRSYRYMLAPQRSGSLVIPPFKLEYADSGAVDTLVSQPITVSIAEPVPVEPEAATPTWLIIVSIVVVIAGAAWWYRRSVEARQPLAEDWRLEYRNKYEAIRKLAEREDYRSFSVESVKLIVALLENRTEKKLSGQTTTDLVKLLSAEGMPDSEIEPFTEFFDFCESAKYSVGAVDTEAGGKAARRLEKIVELLLK